MDIDGNDLRSRRLLVWGAGELGGRVAGAWPGPALGFTATERHHRSLREAGVEPRLGDPTGELTDDDLLLLALPGHRRQHDALRELIDPAGRPTPTRAVLISSTGYYGRGVTGDIDEETPAGTSERAQAIAALEEGFARWTGSRGVILRLGGLYRPGRGPLPALARRGEPPPGDPDRILGLIHYQDAAAATLAALLHPTPRPVYLGVVTPSPTRRQFYEAACRTLGLPDPRFPAPKPAAGRYLPRHLHEILPSASFPSWEAALEPKPDAEA